MRNSDKGMRMEAMFHGESESQMRSKGWIRQRYWLGVWGDDIDILSPNISTHPDDNTETQQQQITLHWSPRVLDTSPVGQGWKRTYCRATQGEEPCYQSQLVDLTHKGSWGTHACQVSTPEISLCIIRPWAARSTEEPQRHGNQVYGLVHAREMGRVRQSVLLIFLHWVLCVSMGRTWTPHR